MESRYLSTKSGLLAAKHLEMFLLSLSNCEPPSRKCIHALRVEIKRLRATKDLLNLNRDSSAIFEMTDSIYSTSADIRTLQLNLNVCRKSESDGWKVLEKYWSDLCKEKQSEFSKTRKDFDYDKFTHESKLAITSLQEMTDQELKSFLNSQIILEESKLLQKYSGQLNAENAHALRKHLKKIIHLNEILVENFSDTPDRVYMKSAVEVAKKIGEWHDDETFIKEVEDSAKSIRIEKGLVSGVLEKSESLLIRLDQRMISLADSMYLDIKKMEV